MIAIAQSDYELLVARAIPKQNQYELVCSACSAIEKALKETFEDDARGHGLGSLVSSVGQLLSLRLRNRLYELSRVRNAVVHERRSLSERERQSFSDKARVALLELEQYAERSTFRKNRGICTRWIGACPFRLDTIARKELEAALRRQLDERPYATNSDESNNCLHLDFSLARNA